MIPDMGFSLLKDVAELTVKPLHCSPCARSGSHKSIRVSFFGIILSTKYWDEDSKLSYYGYRYYGPGMGRWANRDPKDEKGAQYYIANKNKRILKNDIFLINDPIDKVDPRGLDIYIMRGNDTIPIINILHQAICVDTYDPIILAGLYRGTIDERDAIPNGRECFSFGPYKPGLTGVSLNWLGFSLFNGGGCLRGKIDSQSFTDGKKTGESVKSNWRQDHTWYVYMTGRKDTEDVYSLGIYNCILYTTLEFEHVRGYMGAP